MGTLELSNSNDRLITKVRQGVLARAGVSAPADCVRFTGEGTIPTASVSMTTTYTKILPGVDPGLCGRPEQLRRRGRQSPEKGTISRSHAVGHDLHWAGSAHDGHTPSPSPRGNGRLHRKPRAALNIHAPRSAPWTERASSGSAQDTLGAGNDPPCRGMEFDTDRADDRGSGLRRASRRPRKPRACASATPSRRPTPSTGPLPPSARPRSGSVFKVGRTKVTCKTTDSQRQHGRRAVRSGSPSSSPDAQLAGASLLDSEGRWARVASSRRSPGRSRTT